MAAQEVGSTLSSTLVNLLASEACRPSEPVYGDRRGAFLCRRFEEAKATLRYSLQEKPDWVPSYRFLASYYAHIGLLDEAYNTVQLLRTLTNVVVPTATHWRNVEHRDLFLSGLRLAIGETE